MTTDAEPIRDERTQLIQDYLDGHVSRGGLINEEIERQAVAYADRIASSRAYEAQLKAHADAQRAQMESASSDVALRERSNRKALENAYINRFAGENAKVTDEMRESARLYAQRVLAAHDPAVEARAMRTAAQRLEAGKQARTERMLTLRTELAQRAGSNHWHALRDSTRQLRQALDDLDAALFREAMRPNAPQDTPQESGEDSAVPASAAPVGRIVRPRRERA